MKATAKSIWQTRLDNVFGSCDDTEECLASAHLNYIRDFLDREEAKEEAAVSQSLVAKERLGTGNKRAISSDI
jgi:hypothetical protein